MELGNRSFPPRLPLSEQDNEDHPRNTNMEFDHVSKHSSPLIQRELEHRTGSPLYTTLFLIQSAPSREAAVSTGSHTLSEDLGNRTKRPATCSNFSASLSINGVYPIRALIPIV